MMNRTTLPLLRRLPSLLRSSLGRPKWLQRKTTRRKRKCHPWREEQSIIVTASRPPPLKSLLLVGILWCAFTAGTLVRSEAQTPSDGTERKPVSASATDTSPLSNLNLANSSDSLSPLNQSIITQPTTAATANTLINCSDAMTECPPILSSGRLEEVKRTANASVTSLLPSSSSSSSSFSGHSATVTNEHSFLHSLLPFSFSASFSGANAVVPTSTTISTIASTSTFSFSSSFSYSSSSFSSAFPSSSSFSSSSSSSSSPSSSSISSFPNRTHSVQLININQSDAVKRVRLPVLAATAAASAALSTAVGSVHLASTGNRVNLTDNVSRQTNSINGTTVVSAWAPPPLLLRSGASKNNNNSNNVTRQTAAESEDDLPPQQATDGADQAEGKEEEHLHANLSSSVDTASISSNWRCANLSFSYLSYTTNPTRTTANESMMAKSNDNNTDRNRSSSSSLDKLPSVSNKVAVNFERESATNESITRRRPGDCSSSSSSSSLPLQHWPLNGTATASSAGSNGGQKLGFSHMQDDSLSVSAVIDAIATQSSALLSAAAEQSTGGAGDAGPLAPSTLSEHQLDTNSYYRYSSRDNDPSVLLSRYPSLRLPPPPPEFADDFNEGITEITAVAGTSVEIPCNTSIWDENEVSLVLWFRGDTGVPIYRVDARSDTLSKAKHTSADELRKRFHFDISLKLPVLRISPVLPSDAAEYRCRVDFRQSRTQNVLVALNVTVPPKELLIMDVEGQKLEGVIGPYDENSNVLLICEAEGGKPSPEVNWYSGSRLLDSSYTIGPHGLVRNELNIRALNRSDFMSILTCRAWNNNVTEPVSSTVILDMNLRPLDVKILTKSTPTISSSKVTSSSPFSSTSSSSSAIVLAAGAKAEFQCRSIGSRPSAQISWWLGPERLSSNVRDSVNEDGNATISTITFVPDLEDNGKMLTCRADNLPMPHTALKDEKLLNVHFAPQLRISFGSNIGRDSIREGSDVYLECRVRANPPVKEVVWLHESRPLHGSLTGDVNAADASRSTIIMTNQSLVIQKVHRSHRGRYQCVAFNDQGETISEALTLKVNFAPVCVEGQKTQYGVSRNEQIRIRCEVDAEPSLGLTFRWTLNTSGSETSTEWASFTNNATTSIATYRPESSLDYGTLSCLAQNSIGHQVEACVYSVVPAGRPDPVRSCAITNHSMSTLLVECAAGDDGGLRQQFFLEVFAATTQQRVDNQTNSTPNFLVNRLTPGTQYSLVLYAFNAKGRSHSVSLSAVTLSPPEKHMSSRVGLASSFEQIVVHPVLAILIGIVAAIVLVILLIIFLIKSRHNRFQLAQQRNGPNDSCAGLTSNGDLKMKKVKINGTNGKIVSNGKKPNNGNGGKDGSTTNGDLVSNASPSKYSTDGQKLGLVPNNDNADPSNESSAALLTSAMNGSLPPCSENMSSSLALASLVQCDTLMMPTRPTSTGDNSQHSSSSAATTAPLSDLMGSSGQTLYGVASDSCSVMQQQQTHHCTANSGKVPLQSPSHQGGSCRAPNVRHLVDLSSGSTCCSSSTSSSPHTMMQGPPPVPSLPASITQGVMLFAPSELAEAAGGSPGHYGSQHQQPQQHQQYATQYHPYLMGTSAAHSATLPRHYEANMATLTAAAAAAASTMKLYSDDQLVHSSAMYESQFTPVIVNSIDPSYHQVHQHGQPLLYYNSGSSHSATTGNSSPLGASLLEHGALVDGPNNKTPSAHPFHHPHHLKTSSPGTASQTLPRRCSVGPLESGNNTAVDGLYISFSKAPVKGVSLQAKNYSSPMGATKGGGSSHVDCVQTSSASVAVPMESVPLLGPSAAEPTKNGSLEQQQQQQQQQQGNLPSPRPHQICLASSPRKGATAV